MANWPPLTSSLFLTFSLITQLLVSPITCKVCTTPACQSEANRILAKMDQSINPCTDFYDFACGNWIRATVIPDSKSSASIFDEISESLIGRLRALVESATVDPLEPVYTKQAKIFYNQCLDETAIEKLDATPLKSILKQLGGWPVVEGDAWKEEEFNWSNQILKHKELGLPFNNLLQIEATPDFQNSSNFVIGVGEASLGVEKELAGTNYFDDDYTNNYFKLIRDIAVLLGADENSKELDDELFQMVNFEIAVGDLLMSKEEKRQLTKNYRKMRLSDLDAFAPGIPWTTLLNGIFSRKISPNTDVIILSTRYIQTMGQLLEKAPLRVIANYMGWKVVRWSLSMLSKRYSEVLRAFTMSSSGTKAKKARFKTCLAALDPEFGEAVSSLYIKQHFGKASKDNAQTMARELHSSFHRILETVDWMDEATRIQALSKLENMALMVGYPDELQDDNVLIKHYSGLEVSNSRGYYDNVRMMAKWKKNKLLAYLGTENKKSDWRLYGKIANVNAFYRVLENTIVFPAAILQDAVFSVERPQYINYGALGFVVGHEMTHGFDDLGKQFDAKGNNVNWWSEHTDEQFQAKAECIVDQYNNFEANCAGEMVRVNGKNTLGDNIADKGGLRIAYSAYKEYQESRNATAQFESTLPGLDYSPDQLFYIGFAQVWCSKSRPEALKSSLENGSHSPMRYRVLGPVAHHKYFAEAFKCPLNSAMNPVKKCTIW